MKIDRACFLCMAGLSDCALQKDRPNPIFCSSKRIRKRARRWLPQLITRVSSVVHSQFSALLALPPPLSKVTAARRQATCTRWALIRRTSPTRAAANKFQRPRGRLILPRMMKNGSGSEDHRAVAIMEKRVPPRRGSWNAVNALAAYVGHQRGVARRRLTSSRDRSIPVSWSEPAPWQLRSRASGFRRHCDHGTP